MGWTERELHPNFGVELVGLDLRAGLGASDHGAIYETTRRHGLTVIRGQSLRDEEIHGFFSALGDEMVQMQFLQDQPPHARGVIPLRNIDDEGRLLPPDDWNVQQNRANELWHTDLTFQKPRATISLLYARTVPPEGGDTHYCDTRPFWESLGGEERRRLERLRCVHWGFHSRRKYGFTDMPPEALDRYPPIERPLVIEQPGTGRKALTIGSYAASVVGLDEREGERLLDDLLARATVAANVHSHRWRVGDLLLWDNRCMLHRATPFDYARHARDMRAARLFDPASP
jgi:alpha-ketoglutarate-dependent 2,4-dichlorophenoxyacetate dioxygenase